MVIVLLNILVARVGRLPRHATLSDQLASPRLVEHKERFAVLFMTRGGPNFDSLCIELFRESLEVSFKFQTE